MNLRSKALMDDGVVRTTALREAASRNLRAHASSKAANRLKARVTTGFLRIGDENLSLNVARVNSRRAGGTACKTRLFPSAKNNASKGATTVVLPDPIIQKNKRKIKSI